MVQQARIDVDLSLIPGLKEASPAQQAEVAARFPKGIWFATPTHRAASGGRKPDAEWTLVAARPYQRQTATGRAAVYYGAGHTGLVRPVILADGFNYGPSDLPGLWEHLNTPYGPGKDRFLDQLLAAGRDVILLGFDVRHTHIQANAEVAMAAIRRAIEETGGKPLTVGGVSMGGMVTRYALAKMESEGEEHQTDTYFSWDTPHNGAWIPLILQQMAYFFEDFIPEVPGQPKQAELIRSAAAQQLLWAWVENSKYSGAVATSSALRREFLNDLKSVGWFPARPRKLGVANGSGRGVGRNLVPGEVAFDWKHDLGLASATARIQPDRGEKQPVGGMHLALAVRRSTTTAVPPLDGAPGGTLESFGLVAAALKIPIEDRFRSSCFVPAVSATALSYDPVDWNIDPCEPISALPPEQSELDEFQCDTDNSAHGTVTPTLATWLLNRLAK